MKSPNPTLHRTAMSRGGILHESSSALMAVGELIRYAAISIDELG
jgi:hypothetical protein